MIKKIKVDERKITTKAFTRGAGVAGFYTLKPVAEEKCDREVLAKAVS